MMNFIKNLASHLWLVVICVLLCFMLYKSIKQVELYRMKAETFERTISDLHQDIDETIIRMNDSISLYQAKVKSLSFSEDNLKARYNDLLKASKLKPSDVGSVTSVTSLTKSKDTIIAQVDTFGGLRASLNDRFVNIDVEVRSDRKTIIDYNILDSISVIQVQKQHSILFGLFKWKSVEETRVVSHNPKTRIVGLETINIVR